VPFGPAGDTLPSRFTAHATHPERPLRVTFRASFDGKARVKVSSVALDRTDGESLTPVDMTMLQLAQVIGAAVRDAMDDAPGTTGLVQLFRPPGGPSEDELRIAARLYWRAYVSWGSPRQAVMLAYDLPRSTANQWILKARDLYDLPGPHADIDGED
jgi:hypothetical protein